MPLGAEDKIHKEFAALIRKYEFYKQLNCDRWSYDASGEKRSAITGQLLKMKGLNPGKADYEFIYHKGRITYYLYIEFKKPKTPRSAAGSQSENQKKFQNIFVNSSNVTYKICYSVKEAIELLIEYRLIKQT